MAKGNHYDEQAHCYEDLEGENSNAGETPAKGNQWNDDVSYSGGGSKGAGSSSSMGVSANRNDRGKAGGKEEY